MGRSPTLRSFGNQEFTLSAREVEVPGGVEHVITPVFGSSAVGNRDVINSGLDIYPVGSRRDETLVSFRPDQSDIDRGAGPVRYSHPRSTPGAILAIRESGSTSASGRFGASSSRLRRVGWLRCVGGLWSIRRLWSVGGYGGVGGLRRGAGRRGCLRDVSRGKFLRARPAKLPAGQSHRHKQRYKYVQLSRAHALLRCLGFKFGGLLAGIVTMSRQTLRSLYRLLSRSSSTNPRLRPPGDDDEPYRWPAKSQPTTMIQSRGISHLGFILWQTQNLKSC